METRTLIDLMAREPQFWTPKGLTSDCSLGEYIPDWSDLPVGLPIVLAGKNLPTIGGHVESKMEDGSAIWIRDESWARRLVLRADGYMVE